MLIISNYRCLFQYDVDFECSFFNKNFLKNDILWVFWYQKLANDTVQLIL